MDVATRPARTGPLITLWLLRLAVTAHLVAVLAQPILAGRYLTGDVDAITAHGAVGTALAALDLLVIAAAAVYVVGGRGALWVLPAAVLLFLAVGLQIGMGFARQLGVHVPLGVGIVTASVLLTAWVWTPSAHRARPARPRRVATSSAQRGGAGRARVESAARPDDAGSARPDGAGSARPDGADRRGRTARGRRGRTRGTRGGLNRRGFLGLLGASAAGVALAGCGGWGPRGSTGTQLTSAVPLPPPYQVPLPVPPVARPVNAGAALDRYLITQRVARAEILPGIRTPIMGYDGIFPGPTIEARRGRPVVVRYRNELPVPTVAHLHGGHTPADSDGWPLDLLLPVGDTAGWARHGMVGDLAAGEREYRYPMTQRAATLWYHDHRMDFTAPAVYFGLAGFHIVRDDAEDALPLPRGPRELPLMICDRAFAADGSFAYPALDPRMREVPGVEPPWMAGVLGDVVLVNGAPWPVCEVDAARYRLRILNASNARRFGLALRVPGAPDLPFTRSAPTPGCSRRRSCARASRLAPGERFDVVVDFARVPVGTEVTMVNSLGEGSAADVMRFRVVRAARDDSAVPAAARRRRGARARAPRVRDVPVPARPLGPAHRLDDQRHARSTRPPRSPTSRSAPSSAGGSSPTSTTRCTSTSTPSRCCAAAAAGPARRTRAGRTPSTCGPPRSWRWRCGSPSTRAGTCCTATTWNTRTWR